MDETQKRDRDGEETLNSDTEGVYISEWVCVYVRVEMGVLLV